MNTDLKFFTNEENDKLYSRFAATLNKAQSFDVIVGYFRTSGFNLLYKLFEDIEQIRILVGINVDRSLFASFKKAEITPQQTIDYESHIKTKETAASYFQKELDSSDDNKDVQFSVNKFIEYLESKKIVIKGYPAKNLHAKVYITKYRKGELIYGSVITGSSNFTQPGLTGQREFNVEIKDRLDVDFASQKFEELWAEGEELNETYIDTVKKKTWLNDTITPYELYLKLIYEYLEEDINLDEEFDPYLPDDFLKLRYQKQAAIQAKKILMRYNGVFLADVVGLGKTFITALLLQQLSGKALIICPPILIDYWKDTMFEFGIRGCKVESLGKLDKILQKGIDSYDYIVVDEAHRFRNDSTQMYDYLFKICLGKKVILVSATPLNNTIDDIYSQIRLFQPAKKATIPGIHNLEDFFNHLKSQLKQYDKSDPGYTSELEKVSSKIKNKILKYIMVRRTRTDVINYFQDDITKQGLSFPVPQPPEKIPYVFTGQVEQTFIKTLEYLKQFKYTRYMSGLYLKADQLSAFEQQQHRNLGGFMKGLLVKRLESSFYAFRKSIERFITSYEKFIEMYDNGTVYIGDKVNIYDLLDNDDLDKIDLLVKESKLKKWDSAEFIDSLKTDLQSDLQILNSILDIWQNITEDPKLDKFIEELKQSPLFKKNKIIIFTESKETGDYLFSRLISLYPREVIFYSSDGVKHIDENTRSSRIVGRELIQNNFNPDKKSSQNDIRILITTDILSEGINLHRSNILINYDLPWNPTRVMQRSGRINRLGSEHKEIHIFNFFPTTQADEHLGLENNIVAKIQMFHNILGEDARYLTAGEEIGSRELFDILNKKEAYTGEDQEEDSELKYINMIRDIRDNNPDLFQKIKRLPKKARSGFQKNDLEKDNLITFFRLGYLKKLYINNLQKVEEITFFDAVNLLECQPECQRSNIPDQYFDMLSANKNKFNLDYYLGDEPINKKGGSSNSTYILQRLKTVEFRNYQKFTESDESFIFQVTKMFEQGLITKKTAQSIKNAIIKEIDPMNVLKVLQKYIEQVKTFSDKDDFAQYQKQEIILSGYLVK